IGETYYYALAYKEYRSIFLKRNFTWFFLGFLLLIVFLLMVPRYVKKTRLFQALALKPLYRQYKYADHVIYHPFDGFWDLKREKKGSMKAAGILYGLFALMYALRAQFSGYV
ncbi:MAG: hypothetical protein ACYC5K_05120, partial [Saccharofermentanales bacterium]